MYAYQLQRAIGENPQLLNFLEVLPQIHGRPGCHTEFLVWPLGVLNLQSLSRLANFRNSDSSHSLSPSSVLSTEITVGAISKPHATQHTQVCGAPRPHRPHLQPASLCGDSAAQGQETKERLVLTSLVETNANKTCILHWKSLSRLRVCFLK